MDYQMNASNLMAGLLRAVRFAAEKHRDQRRKGAEASPYINHPIEVAEILANIGDVRDLVTLQAAILHDTLEDTETSAQELEAEFGSEVRRVVEEVTDDKSLPKLQRKELQIQHAPHLSDRAKQVKIADKIANMRSIMRTPPVDWPVLRQVEYLDWTEQVVAGCRGCNEALEQHYYQALAAGRQALATNELST